MRRILFIVLSLVAFQSCAFVSFSEEMKKTLIGKTVNVSSENVIEKDFTIADISDLTISIPSIIYYTVSEDAPSLRIVAPDKLFDYIDIISDEENLTIRSNFRIKNNNGTAIYINTSSLDNIILKGANKFYSNEIIVSESMSIKLSGAAEIELEGLQANNIDIAVSGAAEMDINSIKSLETAINISGSADAEFENFDSGIINISISGSSSIDVEHVNTKDLNYAVSGAGEADFDGQADNIDIAISGSGRIDISELKYNSLNKTIKGQGKVIDNK